MNKQLLLLPFFFILFACGEDKSSNSQPFVDVPGWRESGLYAENTDDNMHLSRVEGVGNTIFVKTGEGRVYMQKGEGWVELQLPEGRKADQIKKVGDKLLVGFSWNLALYSYNPVQDNWAEIELPITVGAVGGIFETRKGFVISLSDYDNNEQGSICDCSRIYKYNWSTQEMENITSNWPWNGEYADENSPMIGGIEVEDTLFVYPIDLDMVSYTEANGWERWSEERALNPIHELVYWNNTPVTVHRLGYVYQRLNQNTLRHLDTTWLIDSLTLEKTPASRLYSAVTYKDYLIVGGGGPAVPQVYNPKWDVWVRISQETICPWVEERGERSCEGRWGNNYDMNIIMASCMQSNLRA